MDLKLRDKFTKQWNTCFPGADLPLACYYSDDENCAEAAVPPEGHRCFIADLARIRKGQSLRFSLDCIGCRGGKRYLGFAQDTIPAFEHFLAHGIPGKFEGERYKKTPDLARAIIDAQPPTGPADGAFIVFKRWDNLDETDKPAVIIFLAPPDVLSGLFTLINYDSDNTNAVYAPFSAGCSSIIHYPYHEHKTGGMRAVLGMFDVSARPFVKADILSLAMPIRKFETLIENMEGSFLELKDWGKVKARISKS